MVDNFISRKLFNYIKLQIYDYVIIFFTYQPNTGGNAQNKPPSTAKNTDI
jgi:hypothetical protein